MADESLITGESMPVTKRVSSESSAMIFMLKYCFSVKKYFKIDFYLILMGQMGQASVFDASVNFKK